MRTGFLAKATAAFAAIAFAIALTSAARFRRERICRQMENHGHRGQTVHDLALR